MKNAEVLKKFGYLLNQENYQQLSETINNDFMRQKY